YSFRGIDDRNYYLTDAGSNAYADDTGCGNTLRCGNPAVGALVLLSLRSWTIQMRVDGFRFDLASIFTRRDDGTVDIEHPPLIHGIEFMARMHDVRVIAAAW